MSSEELEIKKELIDTPPAASLVATEQQQGKTESNPDPVGQPAGDANQSETSVFERQKEGEHALAASSPTPVEQSGGVNPTNAGEGSESNPLPENRKNSGEEEKEYDVDAPPKTTPADPGSRRGGTTNTGTTPKIVLPETINTVPHTEPIPASNVQPADTDKTAIAMVQEKIAKTLRRHKVVNQEKLGDLYDSTDEVHIYQGLRRHGGFQGAPTSWAFTMDYKKKVFDIDNPRHDQYTVDSCVPSAFSARFQNKETPLVDIPTFEVLNMWDRGYPVMRVFVDWDETPNGPPLRDHIPEGIFNNLPDNVVVSSLSECDDIWATESDVPYVFIFRFPDKYRDARWVLFACLSKSVVINATGLPNSAYIELEVEKKDLMPTIRTVLLTSKKLWNVTNDGNTRRKIFQKRITVPEASNYMAVSLGTIIFFLVLFVIVLQVNAQSGTCDFLVVIRDSALQPVNPFLDAILMVILLLQVLLFYFVFYNSATSVDPSVNAPKYSDTISDLFKEDKIVMIVLYSILLLYSDFVRSFQIKPEYTDYYIRICFVQLFTVNATFIFSVSLSVFKTIIHFGFVATFSVMTLINILFTGDDSVMEFECRLLALFCSSVCLFFMLQGLMVVLPWCSLRRPGCISPRAAHHARIIITPFSLASETMILFVPFFTTDAHDQAFSQVDIGILVSAIILLIFNVIYLIPGYRGALKYLKEILYPPKKEDRKPRLDTTIFTSDEDRYLGETRNDS